MKKITKKERLKAGNIYCVQCKKEGKKNNAIWRPHGDFRNTMCEAHKNLIKEETDYMTEADHQTWGRL